MARTVLGLGQRSDSFQYGSAESPTLRPCPGLRTVGGEFSEAPDPGRLAHVRGTSAEMDSAIFQFSETTGAPRGLSFAAVKNSAPRARRSPPRRNAGDRPEQKRDAIPLAQAEFGGDQRALSVSNSLPIEKTQPPARPFSWFQSAEGLHKTVPRTRCYRYPPRPAGASRAGPPPRNCLRRLPSVGPDSTRLGPKK